jgi:hypothetical protein
MKIKEFFKNLKNDQGLIMLITLGVLLILVCLNLIATFRSPKVISSQGTGQYALVDFSLLLKDYQAKTEQLYLALISNKQKDDLIVEADKNLQEYRRTIEEQQKTIDRGTAGANYIESLKAKNEKLAAYNTQLQKDVDYLQAILKRRKK